MHYIRIVFNVANVTGEAENTDSVPRVPHSAIGPARCRREENSSTETLLHQGVWLEISLDGGGVKDEVDGLGRVALVDLEASR